MNRVLRVAALCLVLSLGSVGIACAANAQQRILLNDKTMLVGRVIEMKDGIYSIETETLGVIKISADKVLEITSVGSSANTEIGIIDGSRSQPAPKKVKKSQPDKAQKSVAGSDDLSRQQEEVNSQVRSMTMNGDFLDSMMNLSESSAMTDLMQDPEIMEAISRNDYEYLMNSEKMKSLMDSQEIKELLGDVQP